MARKPYGSNLAGPTRASVYWPTNTPGLQSFDAPPPPDTALADFLNDLVAGWGSAPNGAQLSLGPEAAQAMNLPPGDIHLPPGLSQAEIVDLLTQMSQQQWSQNRQGQ